MTKLDWRRAKRFQPEYEPRPSGISAETQEWAERHRAKVAAAVEVKRAAQQAWDEAQAQWLLLKRRKLMPKLVVGGPHARWRVVLDADGVYATVNGRAPYMWPDHTGPWDESEDIAKPFEVRSW